MTKQIIDPLEVINVERDDREVWFVTFGTDNFMMKLRIEFGTVVNLGQFVGDG